MRTPRALSLAFLAAAIGAATPAAASDRFEDDGVRLRLVAEAPAEDGSFRAALLVDLHPGWKTYWLDPGEAGLPPKLDFSGSRGLGSVEASFPPPHRFDDGFARSTVYSAPFAIALTGRSDRPASTAPARIEVAVSLGLCLDVCVPVTAELEADLDAPGDEREIARAFAALPMASGGGRGILRAMAGPDGRSLDVAVASQSAGDDADLFVFGGKGWSFGAPARAGRTEETTVFRLPVVSGPRKGPALPLSIEAVLVDKRGAWRVDGLAVGPAADGGAQRPTSPASGTIGKQGASNP